MSEGGLDQHSAGGTPGAVFLAVPGEPHVREGDVSGVKAVLGGECNDGGSYDT